MLQSFGDLFLVWLIIIMNLKEYNLVIIQVIPKCLNSNVRRFFVRAWIPVQVASSEEAGMPGQRNGGAVRVLVSLKSKLDRHQEIRLEIKFYL